MTCRRKRYTAEASQAKLRRIVSQDATVGLTTEGRSEWCAPCEAWHVETKAAWRQQDIAPMLAELQQDARDFAAVSRSIFDHDCYPMGKCAICEPEDAS